MRITEGHLARHYQGRRGGRGPALLDVAQDHAIAHLHAAGLFEAGLVFKGGTSLRKFRAGSAGRFSTDLDFYAPNDDVELRWSACNPGHRYEVETTGTATLGR